MKDILFNTHDVVLMLVIGLSFMLALRTALSSNLAKIPRVLLSTFFALNALASIDVLLFWGDSIKYAAFSASPWLPTAFSFAPFAAGPVLYWFFRSLAEDKKPLRITDYIQLLPAIATPFYLYWVCYRHSPSEQFDLILHLSIFSKTEAYFSLFLTLKKIIPVIYGSLCVALVLRDQVDRARAKVETAPLPYLYAGFPFIWMWVLFTHMLGQSIPVAYSDALGIFGNYMGLTLTVALFFNYSKSAIKEPAPLSPGEFTEAIKGTEVATIAAEVEHAEHATPQNPDAVTLAARIDELMRTEKPYLNPRLTLERFASLIPASPRQVSFVINHRFQQNYQEYINRFRIEEAKRLLSDPTYHGLGVLEIAERAGFNSKATFNRFFKALVDTTPSAYREQFLIGTEPRESHC